MKMPCFLLLLCLGYQGVASATQIVGAPSDVHLKAIDQHTVLVEWKIPLKSENDKKILGFYVGYKKANKNNDKPYIWETVERWKKEHERQYSIKISNLEVFTEYEFVVQNFYRHGSGSLSKAVQGFTAEGTPTWPPREITLTPLSSSMIHLSWKSPPTSSIHGILQGYKVIYGPSKIWNDETSRSTIITNDETETNIENLQKYTNYTLYLLAFTNGGDGVKSQELYFTTGEGVPSAPQSIKAVAWSQNSVKVTWKPPAHPNGKIINYTLYIKELDKIRDSTSSVYVLPYLPLIHGRTGLNRQSTYKFWVTASTTIGEGAPSVETTVALSLTTPAKIVSFDGNISVVTDHDVKLPCVSVGIPTPDKKWKVDGKYLVPSNRTLLLLDGSLQVMKVTKEDEGIYQCRVSNRYGEDEVTHRLIVTGPPEPPVVILTSKTTKSISFKLKPVKDDLTPITGFVVHYKPEHGDWEKEDVGVNTEEYTLNHLWCGQQYQLYVLASSLKGYSKPSATLNTKTTGAPPVKPPAKIFLEVSAGSVTLHFNAWQDGGCSMRYFVVEYRSRTQKDWILVSNNVKPGGNFVILDLNPATWYDLKITAHNDAGFTSAEYEFATLTRSGGTLDPEHVKDRSSCSKPVSPDAGNFLEVSLGSLTLYLGAWDDGGCPVKYFTIEYKPRNQKDWILSSNNVKPGGNYLILNLDPASWYILKVTAYNDAGITEAEYEFATLTRSGGTLKPDRDEDRSTCDGSEIPKLDNFGAMFLEKFKGFWLCQDDRGSKAKRNILNTIKQMAFDEVELDGRNVPYLKLIVNEAEKIMNQQ